MFQQEAYRCRLLWGRHGLREAVRRGDVLVVVDVLRFSSAVVTAAAHGVEILPAADADQALAAARATGAQVGGTGERYTLSPRSFAEGPPGARVALASPNGAFCAAGSAGSPDVFVGAFLNATATARAAAARAAATGAGVSVLACGERFRSEDGDLRFALEDFLGAGAILAAIGLPRSPEADAAVAVFQGAVADLPGALAGCGSGRELIARGQEADLAACLPVDRYPIAARIQDGIIGPGRRDVPAYPLRTFMLDQEAPRILAWLGSDREVEAWNGRLPDEPMTPALLARWHADPDVLAFVLDADGPVAYGELWVDAADPSAEIAHVLVDPARRGSGLGKAAVTALAAEARRRFPGYEILLRVAPDNATALACYYGCGFVRLPETRQQTLNTGERQSWEWLGRPAI